MISHVLFAAADRLGTEATREAKIELGIEGRELGVNEVIWSLRCRAGSSSAKVNRAREDVDFSTNISRGTKPSAGCL